MFHLDGSTSTKAVVMYLQIKAGPLFPVEAEVFLESRLDADRESAAQTLSESSEIGVREFTESQAKYVLLALYQQARNDFEDVCVIFGDNHSAPQWVEAEAREKALRTALYLALSVCRHQPGFGPDWTHHLHLLP
ncbi:hypothetical protein [Nocardia brasiliensis]|uniref:hypothetical protein n=1 Tax=Nocardia brasiliensis TaxID=37326 RepID=UPI00366CBBBE